MDDDRSDLLSGVLGKGLALLVAVAVVIALGTYVTVHALGLNASNSGGGAVIGADTPPSPLPSTALPVPGAKSGPGGTSNSSDPNSPPDSSSSTGTHGLRLSMSPLTVHPGQRINLTGTYGNHDGVSLQVQRLENGAWADYPTNAQVSLGTFATYIDTTITGAQKFRVYDPATRAASNVVTVTVS